MTRQSLQWTPSHLRTTEDPPPQPPLATTARPRSPSTTHQSHRLTTCLHSTTGPSLLLPPPATKARPTSPPLRVPQGHRLFTQRPSHPSNGTITRAGWDARSLPRATLTPVASSASRLAVPPASCATTPLAPPATWTTRRSSTVLLRQRKTSTLTTRWASWTRKAWQTAPMPSVGVPPYPWVRPWAGGTPRTVVTRQPCVKCPEVLMVAVGVMSMNR